ncbi:predicted protein [Uncinocarpus reesii 1704]|uniref:Uncharacterized protein n=1 Tax=Uncinocarpus reesii (strain UAMH 1704) TaxID=336963 RepID=C4JPI2_UNCRE|nr:uncharacterized protein UREG_03154 [Uncinocarpus reesii 1704]EEP78308.1 predicted protein [Uncinocarpus reesii 1704]
MSSYLGFRGPVGLYHVNPEAEQTEQDPSEPGSDSQHDLQRGTGVGKEEGEEKREYFPSINDVLCVREFLSHLKIGSESKPQENGRSKAMRAERLPVEIVDIILDHAEYWPSIETTLDKARIIRQDQDAEILRTGGLCYAPTTPAIKPRILPHRTVHPCRKIIFTVTSHDQGWGGDHRGQSLYEHSYSWFDAYRIPAFHPASNETQQTPADLVAQYQKIYEEEHRPRFEASANFLPSKMAVRQAQTQHIIWHYRDGMESDSTVAREIEHAEGRGRETLNGKVSSPTVHLLEELAD